MHCATLWINPTQRFTIAASLPALTTVSKSIGGNKYVAGAGIAAALAALGLTVGKLVSVSNKVDVCSLDVKATRRPDSLTRHETEYP